MRTYDLEPNGWSVGVFVRRQREEINYTIGDLAETSGLAAEEIVEIETSACGDQAKLDRIATALHLPTEVFAAGG